MRVTRNTPNTFATPAETNERQEESVFAMDNAPSTPLRDSMTAQRIKARLAYETPQPFIRPKPNVVTTPKSTPVAVPKDRTFPKIIAGIGVCVMISAIFAGPISLCIGLVVIGVALGIDALLGPKAVSAPARNDALLSNALISNLKTKSPVLDLRRFDMQELPHSLWEYDHLKFIVLNESSASRFSQFHFHSEILIGR